MNIVDLLQGDGFALKRVAATHGGEYCGPCPRCSGRDRFRAWPHKPNSKGGRFWCRGCGWRGDAIEYLETYRQMSFQEACNYLGFEHSTNPAGNHGYKLFTYKSKPIREAREMQTPSDHWQSRARKYLEGAINNLWTASGYRWLGWLKEIRGLNEETIRTNKLGLQPIDRWEKREDWGLEGILKDDGKFKKLWLPEGLVIPYFINDRISQISFRRKKSAAGPRYIQLDGSHGHPMVLHPEREILILVESALDGFLLSQEAGDLAGVGILGSAQAQPEKELTAFLTSRQLILLALDADPAGAKARRWWLEQMPNSRPWPPIRAKDPGEMLQQGSIDLRLWIKVGIARYLDEVIEQENEENGIMTSEISYNAEPRAGDVKPAQIFRTSENKGLHEETFTNNEFADVANVSSETKQFSPSPDWQEVPEGMVIPPGAEIRMDMRTGKNCVRWPVGSGTSDSGPVGNGFRELEGANGSARSYGIRDEPGVPEKENIKEVVI